jgi:O-methyltransferase involved in polyketide biosynthesis
MTMAETQQVPEAPNTGRILDYWLGGRHHFPADVAAAQAFDALHPGFPKVFATLRAFIGRAVRSVVDEGISQFLVLGSGIPTQRNVHEVAPGATVLYTDIDRVNIELGKQILADLPNVDYAYCDASDFSTLDHNAAARLLDQQRPLGVVMVGVSAFLEDVEVRQTLSDIYDWVTYGSVLVADFDGEALESETAILNILNDAGEPLYMRRPPDIEPLLGRWELSADGIQPVDIWRNPEAERPDRVFMYGCRATKPM